MRKGWQLYVYTWVTIFQRTGTSACDAQLYFTAALSENLTVYILLKNEYCQLSLVKCMHKHKYMTISSVNILLLFTELLELWKKSK
jgi:hypothetical protein